MQWSSPRREILTRRYVPITVSPCPFQPPAKRVEELHVVGGCEPVVIYRARNEPRLGLAPLLVGLDEPFLEPPMPDPSGIRRVVFPGSPTATDWASATGCDGSFLRMRKRRGLLSSHNVVFQTEVLIDIPFVLEVAESQPGTIAAEPKDPLAWRVLPESADRLRQEPL